MIKVLIVDTHTSFGGGETMLLRMVSGFDRKRVEPLVVVSARNERRLTELRRLGIPCVALRDINLAWGNKFLKVLAQLPNFILLNFRIAALIVKEKPDVIHAGLFYSALFSFLPARLFGKKFIWVAQTLSDFLAYPSLSKMLLRFSDKTILTCADFNRLLKENNMPGREKTEVIYTGLEESFFEKRESGPVVEVNSFSIKRPIVALFGRYDPMQKGHPYFFEAARLIHVACPQANFVIVGGAGNGAEKAYQKELETLSVKLGIRDHTFFIGYIAGDPAWFFPYVDVVMIPSSYEAPSAVAIEAGAAGRPVVAFAVGGIPEVVQEGETGYLVPHGDAKALAEKTIALLSDPQKADAMGEKGREFTKEKFSQEKLVAGYTHLYESLVKRS